ncbi:PAS domain S-box protein [Methanoculleus sp. 7T]|uniref:PAS domain S-box protein n=1 Tax=Methanoculleus sp. 7T TaxID=2937282 RepID=UPI0020BD58FC|nr:PAS domain S-box protein [Methanoculleus sp. 7T]MCK8518709.1 PAS domain S-box protein [Methanoculleus sp. 7T]
MEPHTVNSSPAGEPIRRHGGDQDCPGGRNAASDVTAAMLRQAVETSLAGVCIADRQGRIVFANEALLAMWGYDLEDIAGMPTDFLWLSRRGEPDCVDCAPPAGRWSGTMVARRKDSSLFDVRVSAGTIHDPKTADTWSLLSCLEVPMQWKAEDTPGHRRTLERAIATMPARFADPARIDAAIDDSLEDLGRACGACRTYLSLFNDPRTLLGTTHEWCMPEQKPRRGEFQKFLTSDLPWWAVRILEGETVLVDGTSREGRPPRQEREFLKWHGITATLMIPLRLEARVVGFVGFDQDAEDARFADEDVALLHAGVHIIATALERKQSECIFRESENLYQIVLDAITDAVIVVDIRLRLLLANDAFIAWCEELGLETNVVGKDLFAVLPFLPAAARQQYERVVRTGRPLTSERSFKIGDRTITIREVRIPIFEHGEVTRVITVARDITDQRQVEDLKSKAYTQIERNMEQFALLADHIRNPLQAIMGRAELIDDAEATEKIRQQVQRINAIIDQLDERWAESRKLSTFWRRYS